MCRTFTLTHTLCLHTQTTYTPCSKHKTLRIFSFFSSPCKPDTSSITINDFCPSCRAFFDAQDVTETTRRELVNSFRIVRAYYGSLTPVVAAEGEGGGIELRMDVGEDLPVVGGVDGVGEEGGEQINGTHGSLVVGDSQDEDIRRLSMMNANWWAIGEEASLQSPTSPQPRRDSTSSTLTIWPSGPQAGVENDEFGAGVDIDHLTAPEAAHLARHGLIHPDEFDVINLDDPLPGPVFADGFENQRVHGMWAPLAVVIPNPSRSSGEEKRDPIPAKGLWSQER